MKAPKVEQLANNQFIINCSDKTIFQSYNSIIAVKKLDGKGTVILDSYYWDYSRTTGRYRNQFLNEGIAETRKNIENGTYKLDNLN